MKFGVCIVWYNPGQAQLDSINNIVNSNYTIAIIDNSNEANTNLFSKIERENVMYIHNKNKGGIAGAFNIGAKAIFGDASISYFFTMDQDSEIDDAFFISMVKFTQKRNALLACPNFFDRNAKTYGTFVKLKDWSYSISTDGTSHFCISSGMCITREAWGIIGTFNEELIIDHVDTDYALRAYVKKIPIYVNYEQCLNHAIGEREKRKFLGVTFKPNHHSYIRKYYIVRNGTYLSLKYLSYAKGYFFLNIMRLIHEFGSVIFFEKDKSRKLKYMLKAVYDSFKGKLGAIK